MNDFYVYEYLRSRDSERGVKGSPYYIGKGRGDRAFDSGHKVRIPRDRKYIRFVATGMTEKDAFQAEMLLVSLYGRLDRGTGILRNLTDGGEGPTGHIRGELWRSRQRVSQLIDNPTRESLRRRRWKERKRLGLPSLPTGGKKPLLPNPSPKTLYMREYRARVEARQCR